MGAGGSASDPLDTVLQQSQMVFFCIPYVGPLLAAGASILEAVRSANQIAPHSTYSVEAAIADIGRQIHDSIAETETRAMLANTRAWQQATGDRIFETRDSAHNPVGSWVISNFATFESDKKIPQIWGDFGDSDSALERFIIPDIAPGSASTLVNPSDPIAWADATRFHPDTTRRSMVVTDVAHLDMYCMAHSAFHAMCLAYLKWGAAAFGYSDWTVIGGPVRTAYEESLIKAVDHLAWVLGVVRDGYDTLDAKATAYATAAGTDQYIFNVFSTSKIRELRGAAFLDSTTPTRLKMYLQFLDIYGQTLQGLRLPENRASVDLGKTAPSSTGTPGTATGTPGLTSTTQTLGARRPKTVRFLYESNANGHYVDVTANSTVLATGNIATQNAGSAKVGLYYRVDGGGVNSFFQADLAQAGQLDTINTTTLPGAYDSVYGTGQWAIDSVATPTRQDRLTSLLIPLADGDPVGDRVVAMIYTAAPELDSSGLANASTATVYKSLYTTAMQSIANWNVQHPAAHIVGLRVVLVSTGINSGLNAGPALDALRAAAAALAVDAIVAAVSADAGAQLSDFTVLVNNDDATGGDVRNAFDAAARALFAKDPTVALAREGFDVPCT